MYRFKIMVIDDRISKRIDDLTNFFTNLPINNNHKLSEEEKEIYRNKLKIEFDVIYPKEIDILDIFIKDNQVDAYFLDVIYDEIASWTLTSILQSIRRYNENAPIFMYSTEWQERSILEEVSIAFRNGFPGKTATYFYNLNDINEMVTEFKEAVHPNQIIDIQREREFIKNMIVRSYGITEKVPYSAKEDVAILHISDIQYGDENETKYIINLWREVSRVCEELKGQKRIDGIDLLAITGDISMHGQKKEMEIAKEDLRKLFKLLWRAEYESGEYKERILLVPGNHDYDLNFCALNYFVSENKPNERRIDFEKIAKILSDENREEKNDYQELGMAAYRDFAYDLMGNVTLYEKEKLNFVEKRFKSWNLRIILLNTCNFIRAEKTNGVGIDEKELEDIVNDIDSEKMYTLVLSHHTPLVVENLQDSEKERFRTSYKTVIHTCQAKVWLGGHRHVHAQKIEETTVDECEVYEAATIRLDEEWGKDEKYKVKAKDGTEIQSCRGFQIVLLEKKGDSYEPKVFRYRFDEDGIAHEI